MIFQNDRISHSYTLNLMKCIIIIIYKF